MIKNLGSYCLSSKLRNKTISELCVFYTGIYLRWRLLKNLLQCSPTELLLRIYRITYGREDHSDVNCKKLPNFRRFSVLVNVFADFVFLAVYKLLPAAFRSGPAAEVGKIFLLILYSYFVISKSGYSCSLILIPKFDHDTQTHTHEGQDRLQYSYSLILILAHTHSYSESCLI